MILLVASTVCWCMKFALLKGSVAISVSVDPNSAFGSPYGGFSRATASRLASMPLTLPSVDQDLVNFDPIYMTTRDATGKQFVCRVYHEDELEPETLEDSLFEKAELKQNDKKPSIQSADSGVRKGGETSIPNIVESRSLSGVDDGIITEKELRDRLRKLSQMCAQLHKGWWSYEWYVKSECLALRFISLKATD